MLSFIPACKPWNLRSVRLGLASFALVACLLVTSAAHGSIENGRTLYAQTVRSAVWIVVPRAQGGYATGTGAVIDEKERLILTNYHVVEESEFADVVFPVHAEGALLTYSGDYFRAGAMPVISGRVLARDSKRDLALIQVDELPKGIRAVPLATSGAKPGDQVLAVGNAPTNPQSRLDNQVLWGRREGKVNGKATKTVSFRGSDQLLDACIIESNDLHTWQGDSGGPVVNTRGELVALTSFGFSPDGKRDNTGAIDVSEVHTFMARYRGQVGGACASRSLGAVAVLFRRA
jgi:S1-C subfamily serine protease